MQILLTTGAGPASGEMGTNLIGMTPEITAAVGGYPNAAHTKFRGLRQLIFETAAHIPEVGEVTETLKWGQPSYLTEKSRSGSTIRLAWSPKFAAYVGMYLNCQTTLVETMRTIYPNTFTFEGNRGLLMRLDEPVPAEAAEHCITLALTYHSRKRSKSGLAI